MRICVFGAGAVGGHLAARLAASGNEVSVVARGATLAALKDRGVRLISGAEEICGRVRAVADAAELGAQDAVFVALKANALAGFAQAAAPLLGSDTVVVFAQNGIPWWYGMGHAAPKPLPDLSRLDPGGALARAIPPRCVAGGVVYSANEVLEPGVVQNNVPGNNMLVIGAADDRASTNIASLRECLEKSGLSSPETSSIRASVWSKLVQNLGSSTLCLLTGATVAAVRTDPALAGLTKRIAAEARALATAYGIDLDRAPQRPGGGQSSGAIQHKPSMLQDYERGRPMEVEAQFMTPLAFARAAGMAAPTLESLLPVAAFLAAAKGLYAP